MLRQMSDINLFFLTSLVFLRWPFEFIDPFTVSISELATMDLATFHPDVRVGVSSEETDCVPIFAVGENAATVERTETMVIALNFIIC
jgi:hypothetical protein